ncbi:unnamed protein product [Lactuca saligna]|uniref:PLATZ transcription factor family protein n=1 Tax=Lactuca saligna TaxID=75948 RepID=A0AA35ZD37_LACSI|nr:unnamed protein product [Lactuca saligna]
MEDVGDTTPSPFTFKVQTRIGTSLASRISSGSVVNNNSPVFRNTYFYLRLASPPTTPTSIVGLRQLHPSVKVVILNKRPQSRSGNGVTYTCEVCQRDLLDFFRFCSFGCKLLSYVEVLGQMAAELQSKKTKINQLTRDMLTMEQRLCFVFLSYGVCIEKKGHCRKVMKINVVDCHHVLTSVFIQGHLGKKGRSRLLGTMTSVIKDIIFLEVAEGARLCGAKRIIGVDLNQHKFEIEKKFGVTDSVNP